MGVLCLLPVSGCSGTVGTRLPAHPGCMRVLGCPRVQAWGTRVHVCGAGGCSHAPCGDTAERGCVCQCLAARGERAVCHQGSSTPACGCLRAQSCLCTHTREFVCAGTRGCGHLSSTRSCFVRTHTACTGTGKRACATQRTPCAVCVSVCGGGTRWALGPPAPPVCPPGAPSLQPQPGPESPLPHVPGRVQPRAGGSCCPHRPLPRSLNQFRGY